MLAEVRRGAAGAALVDVLSFLRARADGWEGVGVAAFGPTSPPRDPGLLVMDDSLGRRHPELTTKIRRACVRALAWLRQQDQSSVDALAHSHNLDSVQVAELRGWWANLSPSARTMLGPTAPQPQVARLDESLWWTAQDTSSG